MEELVKIFIDYKNTFDSMRREEIWLWSWEKLGISTALLRSVKNTLKV
jgi:hypothetical protein